MTAPASKEGIARFLSDFRDHTVESRGVYYSAFTLLQDARHLDELGNKPCVRFYRDTTGRIDGLELAVLKPKKPTLHVERSGKNGAGAAIGNDRREPQGIAVTEAHAGQSAPTPGPLPMFCQCGHPEGEHYDGSVCMKIEGMYCCGCEKFIPEQDAESYRKSLDARGVA